MKKYVVGVMVAIVFVGYSAYLRNQHSGPVIAPSSLSNSTGGSTNSGSSSTNSQSGSSSSTTTTSTQYKDGTYTGSSANAYYGNVQVQAVIKNGKIVTINFLQTPNDNPNSQNINSQATPYLRQEAVQAQSANVSLISGATFTSQAFIQSLSNALSQAS